MNTNSQLTNMKNVIKKMLGIKTSSPTLLQLYILDCTHSSWVKSLQNNNRISYYTYNLYS